MSGGYLGVETVEVSNEIFGKYGLTSVRGVAVERVSEGSPAEKAGIRAGDVIVRVNGDEITSSRKLSRLIGEIAPDHTGRVTVFRNGSETNLDVTIANRPELKFDEAALLERFKDLPKPPDAPSLEGLMRKPGEAGAPMVWRFGSRRQIGVGVTPLTKQLAEHFNVDGGVLINNVRENSPAAKSGLRAGDIIVEAEGTPIKNDNDLIRAIGDNKDGSVSIIFVRQGGRQTVNITPEEIKGGFEPYFEFRGTLDAPSTPAAPGVFRMMRPTAPNISEGMVFRGREI
jgi:serine protease Do